MIPDSIIVFSGGIIADMVNGEKKWRSTTYDDSDSFGALGGRDRVEATALLANKYPDAHIVTTSQRLDGALPSQAQVYADELTHLGVSSMRIIREETSTNTGTAVENAVRLFREKGWKRVVLLSSEYHLARIAAFYEREKSAVQAELVSSESVLGHDTAFVEYFEKVKSSAEYKKRLIAENRGIEAIQKGEYKSASKEDKEERPV